MLLATAAPGIFQIRHPALKRRGSAAAFVARSDEVIRQLPRLLPALSDWECAAASAFKLERHRIDYIAAHLLVRHALELLTNKPFDPMALRIAQRCDHCTASHGKPFIANRPDIALSWSHQAGIVSAVVADFAIGTDLESPSAREFVDEAAPIFLGLDESRMWSELRDHDGVLSARRYALRQWVRKESAIKLGIGSLDELRDIQLGADVFPDRVATDFVSHALQSSIAVLDWGSEDLGALGAVVYRLP